MDQYRMKPFITKGTSLELGQGIVSVKVMRSENISACGKLIYAYIASYGGASIPSRDQMLKELDMTEEKFNTNILLLIRMGLVENFIRSKYEEEI